jgi:hypothetical protein
MRNELKAILDMIPRLTTEELSQISAALKAVAAIGAIKDVVAAPITHTDELWVLQSITLKMQSTAVDMTGVDQLKNSKGYPSFARKVPAVVRYIRKVGTDRNTQRAFLNIGVELLLEDLKQIGLAPTSRTLMAHTHRIPAVLARAFPGYLEAGLMHVVLRRR